MLENRGTTECPICAGSLEVINLLVKSKYDKVIKCCNECGYKSQDHLSVEENKIVYGFEDNWDEIALLKLLDEYRFTYNGECVSICECGEEVVVVDDEINIDKNGIATYKTSCAHCGKEHEDVLEEI